MLFNNETYMPPLLSVTVACCVRAPRAREFLHNSTFSTFVSMQRLVDRFRLQRQNIHPLNLTTVGSLTRFNM